MVKKRMVEGGDVGLQAAVAAGEGTTTGLDVLETVMAWLAPQELAHLARTCHRMANAVETLTRCRADDAAQGLERWPVPISNQLDSCRYPWFRYTPSCCRAPRLGHPWGGGSASGWKDFDNVMRRCQEDLGVFTCSGILGSVGCRCSSSCNLTQYDQVNCKVHLKPRCVCGRISDGVPAYTSASKLQLFEHGRGPDACREKCDCDLAHRAHIESPKHSKSMQDISLSPECESLEDISNEEPPLVLECGGACSCSMDCSFRVTQQGLSVRVIVLRQPFTGWSLHAAQQICKGSFVCEYAGELLTTLRSQERQMEYDVETSRPRCGSALLVLREYMPSGGVCVRINIDATRIGNVARFINHACDGGNLLPCIVRSAGSVIPRLALFARREINDGEELTYSYGSCGGVAGKLQPCYCGTPPCCGTLPSEST